MVPKFLQATLRQYDFMIKGLEEVEGVLRSKNIPFHLLMGDPVENVPQFANRYIDLFQHIDVITYGCMYTYEHMYIYLYTNICMHIYYMYICIFVYTFIYICIYIYIYIYIVNVLCW
jgi:hypothetical protein